mmetsp:Transcript_15722/g.11428  ORF Transcript_15722/g.11428 Transcript_15722/m.11428 type:complete len:136 (+) Transcript_15722:226-633(+)
MSNFWQMIFHFFFVGRRFIYAYVLVYCQNYPFVQFQSLTVMVLIVCCYMIIVSPFEDKATVKTEIFNEICILACCHHLPLLTDYLENYDQQFKAGWTLCGVIFLNSGVNIVLMVIATVKLISFRLEAFDCEEKCA